MSNYGRGWEDGYCPTAGDFRDIVNSRRCPPFVDCTYEQYINAGYTHFNEKEFYEKRKEARDRAL